MSSSKETPFAEITERADIIFDLVAVKISEKISSAVQQLFIMCKHVIFLHFDNMRLYTVWQKLIGVEVTTDFSRESFCSYVFINRNKRFLCKKIMSSGHYTVTKLAVPCVSDNKRINIARFQIKVQSRVSVFADAV